MGSSVRQRVGNCHQHDPSLKLKQTNPRPRVFWEIVDVPSTDAKGNEVYISHFQLECRPPGSENYYLVEECFGGVIQARSKNLNSIVEIKLWLDQHAAEFLDKERQMGDPRKIPPADGAYDFLTYAIGRNGGASKSSEEVSLDLDMTEPDSPAMAVSSIPASYEA